MELVRIAECVPLPAGGLVFTAAMGRKHLDPVIRRLGRGKGELVVFDFHGVKAMTASYAKATVIALLNAGVSAVESSTPKESSIDCYPVVANLAPEVREEFNELLRSEGQLLPCLEVVGTIPTGDRLKRARLLGYVEQTVRDTMTKVAEFKEPVTAQRLMAAFPGVVKVETAWNNRLYELHRLRLAQRTKEGRFWRYSLLTQEFENG